MNPPRADRLQTYVWAAAGLALVALFWLLAVGDLTHIAAYKTTGGYVGILCGFSAFYTAIAQILNEVYGRTVLPLGPVSKK